MSNFYGPPDDNDPDLREADLLLNKANALLQRHKPTSSTPSSGLADLPILTDVVSEFDAGEPALQFARTTKASATEQARIDAPPRDTPPAEPPITSAALSSISGVEALISLDTEISRSIENWLATEVPQVIAREMTLFTQRLNEQIVAHARATLLPTLSEHISERIAQLPHGKS